MKEKFNTIMNIGGSLLGAFGGEVERFDICIYEVNNVTGYIGYLNITNPATYLDKSMISFRIHDDGSFEEIEVL